MPSLVGSEMCIRDRPTRRSTVRGCHKGKILKRGCWTVTPAATETKKEEITCGGNRALFFRFAWAWLALAGRKEIPWLFYSCRDVGPPEYVPRSSARAHTCTQSLRGPPGSPSTESKRNDPRAEEQRRPMSKKADFIHSNTSLPFGERDVPRGVTQAGMPQG